MSTAPAFIGIGAQKAGTTWLHYWLDQHPSVCFPGGKETHYWSKMPDPDGASYLTMFAARADTHIQGDITPEYATLGADIIARLHDACPKARIFFSLRNPIERTWAQVRMVFAQHGVPLSDFERVYYFIDSYRCMMRNDFVGTIARWSDVWGSDALHLLLFDDLVERPRDVLTRLSHHIGLDPAPFEQIPIERLREKVFAGTEVGIPTCVRDHLRQRYRHDILQLGEMVQRDLTGWLR